MLTFALLLAGCQREVEPESSTMTITAYSDDAPSSKTTLDASGAVIWSTSDHINLFYRKGSSYSGAEFVCSSVSDGGRTAVFTGSSAADGASSYVTLSPYAPEASCSNDGKLSTTLPAIQAVKAGSFDPSAAVAVARSTDKNSLHFQNEVSLLGVKPLGTGITSITLIGSGPLTGALDVKADGTLTPVKASRAVRLTGTMSSGSEYFASVLPASHTRFKIVLGRNDGRYASFSGGAITLGANELRHFFEANATGWTLPQTLNINEVQCNASGSKVEIYNPGVSAVSLNGWILVKNDKELYAFDQNASVPAGGFYTVVCGKSSEEDGAIFDLSGTQGFDLKLCCGVVVDHIDNLSTVRTIVNGHSLGRLRDGEDVWTAFITATIGSSNNGATQEPSNSKIILNEINGSAVDGRDYIELYNSGTTTENLDDFKIRRYRTKNGMEDDQTLWKGTSGVTLAPGAYLCLYYEGDHDDSKTYPYRLQRDFSAKKNTHIWLQDVEEREVDIFERGTKNSGWNNINMQKVENSSGVAYSYSRVNGLWVYANPTPGVVNAAKAGDIDQTMCSVVINEINLSGNYIEIYNMGSVTVDLKNLQLRWSRVKDGYADNQTVYEWTSSRKLNPGEFLAVTPGKVNLSSYTNKNIHIRLRDGDKTDFTDEKIVWDDFKRGTEGTNWTTVTLPTTITRSIVRVPDGSGDWYLGNASKGVTNGTDVSGGLCPDVNQ